MKNLYSPLEPFDQGMFQVSDIHALYYEQCGNPAGSP
jgi:proline iminopeptidase